MADNPKGSKTPWSYFLIRLLFKFVLRTFYGTIVIENAHLVPKNGTPCIVCANHGNSLTDALVLVTSVPSKRRGMLRLTAKSTQFGHPTFTSWLIESAGTIPIKRRKDFKDGEAVDNNDAMLKLMEALEFGDAVCLFPEGASRYHPMMQPLKTGVARIISDVLTRNKDNPNFEIALQPCSVTYMHPEHFRSDLLVTFHEPIMFTPKSHPDLVAPPDFKPVQALTARMQETISSGTIDAPSWDIVRSAKLAANIYAPLGTEMSLGDYVRVVRTFLNAFKDALASEQNLPSQQDDNLDSSSSSRNSGRERAELFRELKQYQNQLVSLGLKDDRLRKPIPHFLALLARLLIRLSWALALLILALPGLLLWLPIFLATFIAVHRFKQTGPVWDTYDELAQYKLIYGLFSGLTVWGGVSSFGAWKYGVVTGGKVVVLVPLLMWLTLRWLEDGIAAFRASVALGRLVKADRARVAELKNKRSSIYGRVMELATRELELPSNPESYFLDTEPCGTMNEKGKTKGKWRSGAQYFSVRRRRKKDWNEVLRLYDKVDYPDQ